MKRIKQLILLLLALIVSPSLLLACKTTSDGQDSSTAESSNSEPSESNSGDLVKGFSLVSDGVSNVNVIYPNAHTDLEFSIAIQIVDAIKSASGVKPAVKTDRSEPEDGMIEILVGNTMRTPTEYISGVLEGGTYVLESTDNTIIINGSNSRAFKCAFDQLVSGIVSQNGAVLKKSVLYSDYCEPFSRSLLSFNGNKADLLEELDTNYYMIYFHTNKSIGDADFSEYYSSLIESGMTTIESPRNMLGNVNTKYAVCEKDGWTYTIISTYNNKQTRVFVEKKEDNGYFSYVDTKGEKICDPLFFQIGTGHDSGMCYIFRFADGSFFIVDGGMDDSVSDYATLKNCYHIVDTLRQYAPDPTNIRVVGWLITHPHIDHIGALQYFCNNYTKYPEIKVENLLWNNYSKAVLNEDSDQGLVEKVAEYEESINKLLKTGTKIHRTHTGQLMTFGDAVLEIAYTHEMRMGYNKLTSGNGLSIVMRFTVEGQTFLLTGDTTTKSNQVMELIYDNSIVCDFYQTPHHGWGGNTNTLASVVNPRWVLWPCSASRYEIVKDKVHQKYLFSSASRVEAHFVAENKTYVFSLPFDGTNVTVTENK